MAAMSTRIRQALSIHQPGNSAFDVMWAAQISSRYHFRRQAFFERWSRVTSATGVIFGSAAVVAVFAKAAQLVGPLMLVTGALVAAASAVDLVVGTAAMARKHDELRRRFLKLEAQIRSIAEPTAANVAAWEAERLAIEMDEPPLYVGLCLLCENELGRATRDVGERTTVRWWVRLTAQWLQWPDEKALPLPA